ncbi:MAG: iron ABC transporter substrate-binding protein [Bauldia sp.]
MTFTRRMLLRLAAALVAAPLAFGGTAEARTITDSAGRQIEIPDVVTRVFAAGPPAAVLLYAVKPEAMIGWVRQPRPQDLPFLIEAVRSLPALGPITGAGDVVNVETVVAERPDLILDFGTINAGYVDLANRVQQQTGVPYILIDGSFDATPQALRLVGDILGVPAQGEALAAYFEAALAEVDRVLATVPAEARPRIYMARGATGLQSGTRGSINMAIMERVGAINVVDSAGGGLVTVSPEQVIAWAPDTILTLDATFAAEVAGRPEWRTVPAVANGRVMLAPDTPFGFLDIPPSLNRIVGLYWSLAKLYPDAASFDLRTKIREFYELFYHVTPTDEQLDLLVR